MPIIDAQVHAYEKDHPGRPWVGTLVGPPSVTGDEMVAAMDAVGVDGALLVSPYAMYRFDASYALECYARHPGRFGLIKPVDYNDPAVCDVVADWAATDGTVGVRMMLAYGDPIDPDLPGIASVMEMATRHALPVNIHVAGRVYMADHLARKFHDAQIVIDHLGLTQLHAPPQPDEPFADLPNVLKLADYDNVAIKVTGACTLSKEGFPYNDIWDPLARVFDAFGIDRCLWGTDWTRAINFLTYEQGVEPFRTTDRLSDADRATLMGGALQKIYKWTPTGKA
jgi:L-fuconolactonase